MPYPAAVSYITKLLNWKQITTKLLLVPLFLRCFLYHKVTKLKANHNKADNYGIAIAAVSYITKLLNWKQITTKTGAADQQVVLFPISQSY